MFTGDGFSVYFDPALLDEFTCLTFAVAELGRNEQFDESDVPFYGVGYVILWHIWTGVSLDEDFFGSLGGFFGVFLSMDQSGCVFSENGFGLIECFSLFLCEFFDGFKVNIGEKLKESLGIVVVAVAPELPIVPR